MRKELTEEHKRKISEATSGDKNPNWKGGKLKCIDCGKELSYDYRPKKKTQGLRCSNCEVKIRGGKNHPNWQNGKTNINILQRNLKETKQWRLNVFQRDDFTCQICGDNKGGNLNAHHIKPWAKYKELRLNIDNGITLCKKCHITIHKSKIY